MEDKKVMSGMGFELKESSQNENGMSNMETNEPKVNENNSAEKSLKMIALVTLIVGIILAYIMIFTVCFVEDGFNPMGFVVTVGVLLFSIVSWASLNVFANISLTLKDIHSKISK